MKRQAGNRLGREAQTRTMPQWDLLAGLIRAGAAEFSHQQAHGFGEHFFIGSQLLHLLFKGANVPTAELAWLLCFVALELPDFVQDDPAAHSAVGEVQPLADLIDAPVVLQHQLNHLLLVVLIETAPAAAYSGRQAGQGRQSLVRCRWWGWQHSTRRRRWWRWRKRLGHRRCRCCGRSLWTQGHEVADG